MDQKTWLWKKRSTEKSLVADKANSYLSKNEEEELLTEKEALERDLRISNDKLSSALSECNAKDNIAKKQVKFAQEAIAGWEKAETEAISLKQELDNVLHQKAASEERLGHLDSALKQCVQQLRFVREEQKKRIHGAVVRASEEFEKSRIVLDENLSEAGKRIAKLDAENTRLSKVLSGKDKVIEDLNKYRTQIEADFNALLLRVESTEKENASLKYEVRVLEKEHDIRNEEREFNRRTADAAQKQHQESVKKIAKLEAECQRLRLLVRKRLPGPAALAKMKNEVEMLGKGQVEMRRRKSNPSLISSMDFRVDVPPDTPSKRINFLTEQLHMIEEENRILKNALSKNSSESQISRTMYARTPSRLSRVGQVEESLEGHKIAEPGNLCFLPEHSLAASSDVGSDDKISCAESWASALISELEHFKNEKQLGTPSHRNMGTSDMNLMADFAEMEKLAVVSVDYPAGSSHHSSEEGAEIIGPSGSPSVGHSSPAPGREMAPVYDCPSEPLISGQEIQSDYLAGNTVPEKLGDMLKMLLEYCDMSRSSPHDILGDMNAALAQIHSSDAKGSTNRTDASYSPKVRGRVFQTLPNKSFCFDASDTRNGNKISSTRESGENLQSNVSASIYKILELLEGISVSSQDNCVAESLSGEANKLLSYKHTETPTGYMVRVFQWKTAELTAVLRQFGQTCSDLLNGTADLEQFAEKIASNLEWVLNHCFSLQDVSSMKDAIRNHLDWDESRSESEVDSGSANQSSESNARHIQREETPYLHMFYPLIGNNSSRQKEIFHPNIKDECKRVNIELANKESSIVDLEGRLQSERAKGEIQLQESKAGIENFQSEMEIMKQSKRKTEDQIEKQQMMKEDRETYLMEANLDGRKACQKISELENDKHPCKTPEETCHDLKTQLQRVTSDGVPVNRGHWDNQLRNDLEITAASEKLAECQETILNLGKQLKALAPPSDAALFDKVISPPVDTVVTIMSTTHKNINQRSSLLDKMLAEDHNQIDPSLKTKEDIQNGNNNPKIISTNAAIETWGKLTGTNSIDHEGEETAVSSMAIVPSKKNGGRSFLKKLFWLRKKKGYSKKTPFS